MAQLLTALGSGSTRRLITLLLGILGVGFSRYLGIELTETDKELITGLVVFYLGQSAWKETTLSKAEMAGVNAVKELEPVLPTQSADQKLDLLRAMLAEEEARRNKEVKP